MFFYESQDEFLKKKSGGVPEEISVGHLLQSRGIPGGLSLRVSEAISGEFCEGIWNDTTE